MSDEKKPGFFKRLFRFGKSAPEPETTAESTAPEPVLIEDANAQRIAAEIEAARQLAADAAAQEQAAEAKAAAERAAKEKLAADKLAQQALAKEQAEEAKRAAAAAKLEQQRTEQQKREQAAADKAAAEKAALARKAEEQQHAEDQKKQQAETQARLEAERIAKDARAREVEAAATAQRAADASAARKHAAQEKLAAEQAAAEEAARSAALVPVSPPPAPIPEPAPTPPTPAPIAEVPKSSWWQKLKQGLSKTASSMSEGITSVFTKRKLDDETLEELEDILIQADLGIDVSARICAAVGKGRYNKEIDPQEVKSILATEVAKVLDPVALPLIPNPGRVPYIILMIGVNGSGKTTTIGKLAAKFRAEGKSVMLAAGDTFRAAAIEQLKVWGERTGVPVIARDQGGDAASLAFDAVKTAQEQGIDILLIDTAGRLQNRTELMAELEKVIRVIKKLDADAPHASLLVLDATVGQNALSQVEIFGKTAGVTGLVMTKLDGTARGGILVAIAEKFALPVHFIGVGEGVDDLEPFEATDFARAIAGLEQLKS